MELRLKCKKKLKSMDPELYNAAINGSESFSEKIKGVDLSLQLTSQGNSLLHIAAKSGKNKIAEEILNSQPSLMCKTNSEGNTPLHIAASLGHLEMTQLLINPPKPQGVEVHIELQEVEVQNKLLRMVNLEKDMPMHGAVKNGHNKIVDILIRKDPNLVSFTNSVGESPLFLAVDRGFYKIALHILEIVPKCSYEGRNKMNVLHAAAIRTHEYYFVRELLNNRPSALLEKDDFGWIPLHHAAHAGNAVVVELFLERFIQKKEELFLKINHLACIMDKEGMSALHISAKEGHVDVMRTLITKCPEICELLNNRGRTALHIAVESGKSDAVKNLLEIVAFQDLINKQDKEGNTPLHLAAVKGSFALLEMLAQNSKVDKGATNKKGMTAMDIVPSNMQLNLEDNEDIETGRDTSNKLKMMGFLPSLQQGLTREAKGSVMKGRHGQSQQTERKEEAETTHESKRKEKEYERIKDMVDINLLIVTIIATVTFAAGITLPGGYNTSIDSLQTLTRNSTALQLFVFNNSMAFGFSSASMIIHFIFPLYSMLFGASYPKIFALILTECALLCMIFAFMYGTFVVFPNDSVLTWISQSKFHWLSAASLKWTIPVSTGFSILLPVLYLMFATIVRVFKVIFLL